MPVWFKSTLAIAFAGVAFFLYLRFITPSAEQVGQAANSLVFEVRNGADGLTLLDTVDPLRIPREEIPDHLRFALLAMEDRNFYEHPGVDLRGIARAVVAQLRGGNRQGGSTLTQQLAKNLFYSHDASLWRKLREAMLAHKIEGAYDKDEILGMYLNRVYFGEHAYGIEAAARIYFGVRTKDLDLYQSALLIGSLPNPSHWNLHANPARARERARLVLQQMVELGYLDRKAMQRAIRRGIRTGNRTWNRAEARFLFDWLRPRIQSAVKGRPGRFTVYTTLDTEMQIYAQQALAQGLHTARTLQVSQGAMVVLDLEGQVRAMIGSREYTESPFNRATQAKRQPGSAFKPIIYLEALREGWTPGQQIEDEPVQIGDWNPRNIDDVYLGPITLETALAKSRNAATVRLFTRLDAERVLELSQRLGITAPLPNDPSLALGTGSVSLLELTSAYIPVANGGYKAEPRGILGVRTHSGKILVWNDGTHQRRILKQKYVTAMDHMLHQVTAPGGTGHRAALQDTPVAGKTGTSQDYRDAWFIGYTNNLIAGVWMGNDNNRPMRQVTGGSIPASTWRQMMRSVERYMDL